MIVDPIYDNARLYRIRKETEDIKMEKKDIDWSNLSFGYQETDYSYVSNYKDGKWDDGQLTKDHTVTLNECAGVFQYAQTCFEGLKAYTTEDGRIVCFRPDLNAQRLKDSCERLEMPVFPEDRFVKAVEEVVKANAAWVPPYGSGATLYIRPYIMGTNAVIGVKPADEDFDSATTKALEFFERKGQTEIHRLNPIKDDTDTEYAIRLAIREGARSIVVLGATGSRIDHVLGNISLLGIGLESKTDISIIDTNNRIRMADKPVTIEKSAQYGRFVSLIAVTDDNEVSLRGFKYPVTDYSFDRFTSLGISNEIIDDHAVIDIHRGKFIIIESKD